MMAFQLWARVGRFEGQIRAWSRPEKECHQELAKSKQGLRNLTLTILATSTTNKKFFECSQALEAAIKEFDIAKQALLSADEQLSVHRAEKALERINTLENYLAAEAGISLCFHVPPQSLVTLCWCRHLLRPARRRSQMEKRPRAQENRLPADLSEAESIIPLS